MLLALISNSFSTFSSLLLKDQMKYIFTFFFILCVSVKSENCHYDLKINSILFSVCVCVYKGGRAFE